MVGGTGLKAHDLLTKLHLSPIIGEAETHGIGMHIQSHGTPASPRLWFSDVTNATIGGVGLDPGALALVLDGKADHNLWKTMRAMVQGAFTQARETEILLPDPANIIQKAPLGHPLPEKPAPVGQWWDVLAESDMEKMPTVPLFQAVALLQPVRGSDPGSRYFVVAGYLELKVAARWLNGTLSIRAEGQALQKPAMRAIFTEMGFSKVFEGSCSVHLLVDNSNDLLARQTLGSVLAGIPHGWRTPPVSPYALATTIKDKGS